MKHIHILGISGSLRTDSTNSIILKTLGESFLPPVTFEIFTGLDEMPHFSPGLEDTPAVTRFKSALRQADAVVICTPEYAFGVPGTLKNALDWTVSTGELNDKPVAAISASPLNTGGGHALASLLLTLTALGTRKEDSSALSIPNVKKKIDAEGRVTDAGLLVSLLALGDDLLSRC